MRRAVTIPDGNKKGTYIPIAINREGLEWSLLARDVETGLLHQIKSIDFGSKCTIGGKESYNKFVEPEINIIGLGDFSFSRKPCKISVDLNAKGFKKLHEKSDPLFPLIVKFEKEKYYSRNPEGIVHFLVYVNDDFLEELSRLDRNKYVKDIYSDDVDILVEYEAYLRRKSLKHI